MELNDKGASAAEIILKVRRDPVGMKEVERIITTIGTASTRDLLLYKLHPDLSRKGKSGNVIP